jgi:hypothetical protein
MLDCVVGKSDERARGEATKSTASSPSAGGSSMADNSMKALRQELEYIMSFTEYSAKDRLPLQWELWEDVNPDQPLELIPKDFMGRWGKRFAWGIGCKLYQQPE